MALPATIRVDQGSEFVSRDFDLWDCQPGVTLDVSRLGNNEERSDGAIGNSVELTRIGDEVNAPSWRHCNVPRWRRLRIPRTKMASMEKVSIIGLDLAKRAFQLHGASATGETLFRRKLSREKILPFLAEQPSCIVAMEACGSAHYFGRVIRGLAHEVWLIPPSYVKPFVKRQKSDAADAEAIAEAASRPTMRFVPVESEDQQARHAVLSTRPSDPPAHATD